jgi:hypothetical protein
MDDHELKQVLRKEKYYPFLAALRKNEQISLPSLPHFTVDKEYEIYEERLTGLGVPGEWPSRMSYVVKNNIGKTTIVPIGYFTPIVNLSHEVEDCTENIREIHKTKGCNPSGIPDIIWDYKKCLREAKNYLILAGVESDYLILAEVEADNNFEDLKSSSSSSSKSSSSSSSKSSSSSSSKLQLDNLATAIADLRERI